MTQLHLQIATSETSLPTLDDFRQWVDVALPEHYKNQEITLRLVDEPESQQLNQQFRGKNKPTNVLAFPCDLPPSVSLPILGDLVICAPIVKKEALLQDKTLQSHWAHLTLHGILHLLGYDHVQPNDAVMMENLEIQLMQQLGFADPYNVAS